MDAVTYRLVASDTAKGKAKHLEDMMLDALASGQFRLFVVGADGEQEVHVSDAVHSRGRSKFDPKDAAHDKHDAHPHGHKHDGSITFTLAPVSDPSGDPAAATA